MGVDIQSSPYVGIHWLTLNVRGVGLPDVISALLVTYGSQYELTGGARFYAERRESSDGRITVLSGHRGDGGEDLITVNFTGQACEAYSWESWHNLYTILLKRKAVLNVSRLDFAVDGVPVTVGGFRDACIAGGVRFSAKSAGFNSSWRKRKVDGDTQTEGSSTFYVGSSASERMLRVYDQRKLDGGEVFTEAITLTRFEVQLRDAQAKQFFEMYLADFEHRNGVSVWLGVLTDMLHVSWTPLRDWLDIFESMFRVYQWQPVPAVARTIEQKIGWLYKSVSKTLAGVALYIEAGGGRSDQVLEMLRACGDARLKESERQFYSRQLEVACQS